MEEELKQKLSPKMFRKYVPPSLSPTEKREQIRSILMGIKRPKIDRKPRRSKWTIKAHEFFGKTPSLADLSKASGVKESGLKEIIKRGEKAYYTSGSRPNQTPESWGIARLYAVLFGSKGARRADADLVKKFNIGIFPDKDRMSGSGIDTEVKEIMKEKTYPDNFSKEVQSIIKKGLFNPSGKGLNIMGSMGLRSQKYASDFDLWEVVNVSSIDMLETRYKRIVRELIEDKKIFIGDIKLGNYEDWRIVNENGYFADGKLYGYDAEISRKRLTDLYKKKVVDEDFYKEGMRLLIDNPNIVEWNDILDKLRLNIVRWRPTEVLKGWKILGDGKTRYTLKEALQSKSLFKMDWFGLMSDGIFQEFSVIYDVRLRNRRLNIFPVNIEVKLKEDMEYYAKVGQWWKFIKRFFSLTNYYLRTGKGNKSENDHTLVVLNEILNSDLGIVANLQGDINGLLYVMENENAGAIDIKRAKEEVDDFTDRLSNVYTLNSYLKAEPEILREIEVILKAQSKKPIIKNLMEIYEKLNSILNEETKKKMGKVGMRVETSV